MRGAVRRIWAGERDAAALCEGKDAGTTLAVKAILFHATAYDTKYGGKETCE